MSDEQTKDEKDAINFGHFACEFIEHKAGFVPYGFHMKAKKFYLETCAEANPPPSGDEESE